jgi:phosphatidylserine/phosphatidylglycerophosphate/cardiolipin synthase-like enzyme
MARTLRAGRGAERWGSRRDLRTMVEGTMSLGDVSVGNTLTLLRNGDENFRLMWRLMREATKSIYVQTYTLEPDDVGLRTLQELEHAAERGLDVRLIFDRLGSIKIDPSHLERLRELRAKVIEYDPRSYWRFGFLHRNHRKMCVLDEKIAIVGGMNVSNDYAGPEAGGRCSISVMCIWRRNDCAAPQSSASLLACLPDGKSFHFATFSSGAGPSGGGARG